MRSPPEGRRHARTAALLALAVAVLFGVEPAAAQGAGADLDALARGTARAWQDGNVDVLAERMPAEGIRLDLPGASHPALSVRLARAALRDLHGRAGRGPVTVRQIRLLGGEPARGFLEMTWRPVAAGMTEPLEYTVFSGLEERDGGWWIVELRVLARH